MGRPRAARAFTLLEIAFAMALVATVALGMFAAEAASARLRSFTRELDLAREAARAELEKIRAIDPGTLPQLYASTPTYFAVVGLASPSDGQLPGRAYLSAAGPPAGSGLLHAVVEVRWTGIEGGECRYELGTYVPDGD